MIDRVHTLPLTQQASLLRLSRSSVYYGATIWVRKCVNQDEKL